MGLIQVAFIVLIVLRFIGIIDWSWWIVLAPFWIGILVWLVGVIGNSGKR
jgi:hypothetical protein